MDKVTSGSFCAAIAVLGLTSYGLGGCSEAGASLDTCREMFASCYDTGTELQLRACLLADEYSTDGPLPLVVALCNPSERAMDTANVMMDFWFGSGLEAIIVDSNRDTLFRQVEILMASGFGHSMRLFGGEFLGRVVDLRCEIDFVPGEEECSGPYYLDEPGDYSVAFQLYAFCGEPGCEQREPEVLLSPPVTVSIVPD